MKKWNSVLFILALCVTEWVRSAKLKSSRPKVMYEASVRVQDGREDLAIMAFEEPVDVIERFAREYEMTYEEKIHLLNNVCEEFKCRRDISEILITDLPLSWFSEVSSIDIIK